MTRSELVQKILTQNFTLTLSQAEACVSIILDEISQALVKGKRVELRGFGVFMTKSRRQRVGRNPRTGEPVKVEAKEIPFFKAGKQLKNLLNAD